MSASVCASSSSSPTMSTNEAGWDSDGSLSWEDFFGTSTDLVPTLLGMYDSLIGRVGGGGGGETGAGAGSPRALRRPRAPPPPPRCSPAPPPSHHHPHHHRLLQQQQHQPPPPSPSSPRPLSISSIASSSSSASSSGASSCSGGGSGGVAAMGGVGGGGGRVGGGVEASCAYLASIESLDDASDDDDDDEDHRGGSGGGRPPPGTGGGGSLGSGDSGRCSPGGREGQSLPFAQRVVAEVLDSERIYVRDLRQVVLGYLHCWRSQTDCAVSEQQLADLFSNIEEIYEFNSVFLERLEACGLEPVCVARCFVQHTTGFSIYTHYCTHYPRAVAVLTELMRREASARAFRERQTALAHALPLGSFLLKPVQRVLKYHLLLHNMLKHVEAEGAAGRADVARALASMTDLAARINGMKRRHEHAVRVQEIQSLLYGWEGEDLTTFGELCAEGAFRLAGAKALRHAFLFDRMLLITKQRAAAGAEGGTLGYKAHILCSNLMLIESVPGEPLSFHVIPFDNPRLQYTLRARNLEQKREWALQLKRVILENYNAVIPSHARRLVMELGQHRTDDEILADKTPPRRQHSAPEYLEKRKQDRERRKSEVGLRQRLRRARKSDAGLSPGGGDTASSPTSQRSHRRASSSGRERSHSRDGLRSVSPAAIKERFGSWRRKSEPGVYSSKGGGCDSNTPPASLALLPERPASDHRLLQVQQQPHEAVSEAEEAPLSSSPPPSPAPPPQQRRVLSSAAGGSTDAAAAAAEPSVRGDANQQPQQQQQRSLEEIVGALLLQNRDFQKALRRQQRRQQTRGSHLQLRNGGGGGGPPQTTEETSDTEEDEDDDGAYESLTLPHVLTPPPPPSCSSSSSARRLAPVLTLNGNALNGSAGCAAAATDEEEEEEEEDEDEADYVTLSSDACSRAQRRQQQRRRSGEYDNLQQIWESVRAQQEEIRRLAEREGVEVEGEDDDASASGGNRSLPCVSLRRAQSFCAAAASSSCSPPPTATAPPPPPAASSSLEALLVGGGGGGAPTTPAVWLRQQGAHLASPSPSAKKAGSLPRSFPLAPPYCFGATAAAILAGTGPRPFTIASDPPSEINFEDIERFMAQAATASGVGGGRGGSGGGFPLASPGAGAGDTTEDESLPEAPTPAASLQDINVHPQHKIYRPASAARASLRQVVVSVGARLTSGLRSGHGSSAEALDDTSSEAGAGTDGRRASRRLVAALRHYGKTRLRLRSFGSGGGGGGGNNAAAEPHANHRSQPPPPPPTTPPPPPPPPPSQPQPLPLASSASASSVFLANGPSVQEPLPIYKQGSSRLGARIALCSSSDYADPRQVLTRLPPQQQPPPPPPDGTSDQLRPDSVLSASSASFTSSSGSSNDRPPPPPPALPPPALSDDEGSADSFYERSFEAIEALLLLDDNDVFRDSAVFSDDHEDHCDVATTVAFPSPSPSSQQPQPQPKAKRSSSSGSRGRGSKVPPPVPAKPDTLKCRFVHVKERSRVLAETAALSLAARRNSSRGTTTANGGDDWEDSGSQHSASTVVEVALQQHKQSSDDNAMQQKGWVRHVIGKLQGPADTAVAEGRKKTLASPVCSEVATDLG